MRFTCVSKWWGSIIADPKFTLSHYKLASLQQILSRRLLLWNNSDFESLDLDTSSVRKLTFPYNQPGREVQLLGSCNGLVFLGTTPGNCHWDFYVWNPTTRFVQKLPDPSFSSEIISLRKCGFGYVSAADDYKLVLGAVVEERIKMFSWRANSWKMIEVPLFRDQLELGCSCEGTVLNEALHWIQTFDEPSKEEADFSTSLGVVSEGCLSVACLYEIGPNRGIELWVMKEYSVSESWTKLSTIYIGYQQLQSIWYTQLVFYWEICVFTLHWDARAGENFLIRFDLQEDEAADKKVMVSSSRDRFVTL